MTIHFIPDIHGRIEKLEHALFNIGFSHRNGAWRHPQGDTAVFLGDFIDRGPDGGAVLRTVRDMIEAGSAQAIMGNHELNAIHYHTDDPITGDGLRPRSQKNTHQHAAFLKEFPLGTPEAFEMIEWMSTLPLAIDGEDFRAVHACWDDAAITRLRDLSGSLQMNSEQLHQAALNGQQVMLDVERVTKGPEIALPDGYVTHDKEGTARSRVRSKWWDLEARTWDEVALSVFDPRELPEGVVPSSCGAPHYPADQKPVFFGHYWLQGAPVLQAPNALCLDYSAGLDGPVVTYRHESGAPLSRDRIEVHDLP
jgi:hypothetical protein